MKKKYSMLLGEESRYSEVYIIYPTDGNYIHEALCTLPAGNELQRKAAKKVLKALNK